MEHWWDKWPEIYEREINALDIAGLTYEIDSKAKSAGQLIIKVLHRHDGRDIWLTARYPAHYPFTRFTVYAPELSLPRHQNPLDGQLCLIPRSTIYWRLTDTLAQYVVERVPKMIEVSLTTDKDFQREYEEPQGEPDGAYYAYPKDKAILISSLDLPPNETVGHLVLGYHHGTHDMAAVLSITNSGGKTLWEAAGEITRRYPKHSKGRCELPSVVRLPTGGRYATSFCC